MKVKTPPKAVLTGDIVQSTMLPPQQEGRLLETLATILQPHPYEFYRGDSFQVYIEKPLEALQVALACRAVAIDITTKDDMVVKGDIRIGIGIGEVPEHLPTLGSAKGEAFLLSGRALDQIQKTGKRLSISCSDKMAGIGFQVIADYIDSIFQQMTGKQADVIVELLQGVTQQHLSVTREKAKSTISELANAGRWPEIERILQQYKQIIELLS